MLRGPGRPPKKAREGFPGFKDSKMIQKLASG